MGKLFDPFFSKIFDNLYYLCRDGQKRHIRDIPSAPLVKVCKIYMNHILSGLGYSRLFCDIPEDNSYNGLGAVTPAMQLDLLAILKIIHMRVDLQFDQPLFDYRKICRQAIVLRDVEKYYYEWGVANFSGYHPSEDRSRILLGFDDDDDDEDEDQEEESDQKTGT